MAASIVLSMISRLANTANSLQVEQFTINLRYAIDGCIDPTVGVMITSLFLSGGDCMYNTIRTACKYSSNGLKTLHKLLENTLQIA